MSGLLQRGITAVFFVIVMIALCLWEYLSMTLEMKGGQAKDQFRKIIALILGMIPFLSVAISNLELVDDSLNLFHILILVVFPTLFLLFIFELFSASKTPFANVAYIILGIVYIGIPFALLVLIAYRTGSFSTNIILGMLLLTWTNDTGAYLVGSQIGKTPLLPRISPKKTWEGSLGGVAVGLLVAYLLSLFFEDLNLIEWIILAIIVVIFGSIGDLIESMLKRSRGVKDSGTLLPGHGGFLDRFDAFYFLIPFAAAYLLWS
ncbi:MAG: phosphatidate cytidylyltransferase [Patescibacteria group bacterium]|jgi:phosphatidate cytidylyltransferase